MPDINGIPYVESSDLVSAYPTVSQDLAQEVSDQLASKLDLAGGKILQIVRATDTTNRNTTSTSFVDANISATITPQKNDSAVLLIWSLLGAHITTADYAQYAITDNSNNVISGAEGNYLGSGSTTQVYASQVFFAYATPATTSATTYKGRYRNLASGTSYIYNSIQTGQFFAIEVSA